MESQKLSNWTQLVTGVAVLIGLGLVVWELQQARQLARAQISSESFAFGAQNNAGLLGEEAAAVIAKACRAPEKLTEVDYVILNAHYANRVNVLMRMQIIEQRSGLYDGDWHRFAPGVFNRIFETAAGRGWWKSAPSRYEGELAKVGNDLLAEITAIPCNERFEVFQRETRKAVEGAVNNN